MKRPVPGIQIESQPDEVIQRMGVYGEARGESAVGKLAVLAVAATRAEKHGTSIGAQFLAPDQFSCFRHDDPNRGKLLGAWKDDEAAWAACDAVCELHAAGLTGDPTHGATHYYVANMPSPPHWGRGNPKWEELAVIGRHVFGVAHN